MSATPQGLDTSDAFEELRAIYDSLPRIDCQKRCHGTCGPIVMSGLEWDRIARHHGARTCDDDLVCPYLERASGLCGVYDSRPLSCRLGGVTEALRCQFGCEPERVLTDLEVAALIERVEALSRDTPRTVWPGWQRYLEAR